MKIFMQSNAILSKLRRIPWLEITLLVVFSLSLTVPSEAAQNQVGTFKFNASFDQSTATLTIAVVNTSQESRNTMKCLGLRDTHPGGFQIQTAPQNSWFFPDSVSACAVFRNHFIHNGIFTFRVNSTAVLESEMMIGFINRAGETYVGQISVAGTGTENQSPLANAGVDQIVADSDGFPGEFVVLNGSGSSDDNGIASYSWYLNSVLIAEGVSPTVFLEDSSINEIELEVTDSSGKTASDTVVIKVLGVTQGFNGVIPNPVYQLPINNVGRYDEQSQMAQLCVTIIDSGAEPNSGNAFNLNLNLASQYPPVFNIVSFDEFNPGGVLNADGEMPDCSGTFLTESGELVDTVQIGEAIGEIRMYLENNPFPLLRVDEFSWLPLP